MAGGDVSVRYAASTNMSAVQAGVDHRRFVPRSRLRCLDLIERQALLDHLLNAVADDRHHVAVRDHVGLVADAPVPGNHVGPAFLLVAGDRNVEDMVETRDHAIDRSTGLDVDHRETAHVEDVARADDVQCRKYTMLSPSVCALGSWNT